jgi:hypothetical protein
MTLPSPPSRYPLEVQTSRLWPGNTASTPVRNCRLLIGFNSGHYKTIYLGSYLVGNPPALPSGYPLLGRQALRAALSLQLMSKSFLTPPANGPVLKVRRTMGVEWRLLLGVPHRRLNPLDMAIKPSTHGH